MDLKLFEKMKAALTGKSHSRKGSAGPLTLEKNDTLFIGPHIPKCAGMTFIESARSQLGSRQCICDSFLKRFFLEDNRFPEEYANLKDFKVIFGHAVDQYTIRHALNHNLFIFTFLRNPIDRILSHYAFLCRHRKNRGMTLQTFEEYYREVPKNSICKWLVDRFPVFAGSEKEPLSFRAARVLKAFDFVCSIEDIAVRGAFLYHAIGLHHDQNYKSNVSPSNQMQRLKMKADIKRIEREHADDIDLFTLYQKSPGAERNPFGFDENIRQQGFQALLQDKLPKIAVIRSRYAYLMDNLRVNGLLDEAEKVAIDREIQARAFFEAVKTRQSDSSEAGLSMNTGLPNEHVLQDDLF